MNTYRNSRIPLLDAVGNFHDHFGHFVAHATVSSAHATIGGFSFCLFDGIIGVSGDPVGKEMLISNVLFIIICRTLSPPSLFLDRFCSQSLLPIQRDDGILYLPVKVKDLSILHIVVVQEVLELLVHHGHHLVVVVAKEQRVGSLHLLSVAVEARHLGDGRATRRRRRGRRKGRFRRIARRWQRKETRLWVERRGRRRGGPLLVAGGF